jgi:hypothetical protein
MSSAVIGLAPRWPRSKAAAPMPVPIDARRKPASIKVHVSSGTGIDITWADGHAGLKTSRVQAIEATRSQPDMMSDLAAKSRTYCAAFKILVLYFNSKEKSNG